MYSAALANPRHFFLTCLCLSTPASAQIITSQALLSKRNVYVIIITEILIMYNYVHQQLSLQLSSLIIRKEELKSPLFCVIAYLDERKLYKLYSPQHELSQAKKETILF